MTQSQDERFPSGTPDAWGTRLRPYSKDPSNPAMWLGMFLEHGDRKRFNEQAAKYSHVGEMMLRQYKDDPEAQRMADVWAADPGATFRVMGGARGMAATQKMFRERTAGRREQEIVRQRGDVFRDYLANLPEGQEPQSMDLLAAGVKAGIPSEYMKGATDLVEAYETDPESYRIVQEDGVQYWAEGPNAKKRVLDTPLVDDLPIPKVPAEKRFASEGELRREYNKLLGSYIGRRGSVAQIVALADMAMESPMAQRGLIFSIMKLFDPTSVVRESEQATVENARGVPATVRNSWNKILEGDVLTNAQVNDIIGTAKMSLEGATKMAKEIERQYRNIAKENGLSVTSAVPNYIGEYRKITDAIVAEVQDALGTDDPVEVRRELESLGYTLD